MLRNLDVLALTILVQMAQEFILTKAQAVQKEIVYSNGRASRENSASFAMNIKSELPIDVPAQTSTSTSAPITSTPTSSPASMDPITELIKQFSNLALLIQANMRPSQPHNRLLRYNLATLGNLPIMRLI